MLCLARVIVHEVPRTEAVVRRRLSPCRGHQSTCRRLRVLVRRLPRPATPILEDPRVGLAYEIPGPPPGTIRPGDCAACCRGHRAPALEEEPVARTGQRQKGARRTAPRKQQQRRTTQRGDAVAELARTARELEAAVQRGRVTPAVRTKFQAVAMLRRDEPARLRAADGGDSRRDQQLKRLDGIATILATTAVRDATLLAMLSEDADVSDAARTLKREMQKDLGVEPVAEEIAPVETVTAPPAPERQVVPQSVISRQLANPFLAPDFSTAPQRPPRPRRLASWELLNPLFGSFERAGGGAPAGLALPAPTEKVTPAGPAGAPRRPGPSRHRGKSSPRPAGSRCPIRARWSPPPRPVTGRSCWPTSRAWARRPRRCSRPKRRMPIRCSSWCRTWS